MRKYEFRVCFKTMTLMACKVLQSKPHLLLLLLVLVLITISV